MHEIDILIDLKDTQKINHIHYVFKTSPNTNYFSGFPGTWAEYIDYIYSMNF